MKPLVKLKIPPGTAPNMVPVSAPKPKIVAKAPPSDSVTKPKLIVKAVTSPHNLLPPPVPAPLVPKKTKKPKKQHDQPQPCLHNPFQTVKTSLKSVVKDPEVAGFLYRLAATISTIFQNALHFIKLYLIHCFDNQLPLPIVNEKFALEVLKVVSIKDKGDCGKPPNAETIAVRAQLSHFYLAHFKPSNPPVCSYSLLGNILKYAATEIVTSYENNIKFHFIEHLEHFINVMADEKDCVARMKQQPDSKKIIGAFYAQLRAINGDILDPTRDPKSDPSCLQWIKECRKNIMPQRDLVKSFLYDIKCSPQDYLPGMLYMSKTIEHLNAEREILGKSTFKLYNACPLRTSTVPGHFTLDTDSLLDLCVNESHGTKTQYKKGDDLETRQNRVWALFFKTEKRYFHLNDKHKYTFHHMIKTDGISCCIVLHRKGQNPTKGKGKTSVADTSADKHSTPYIHDLKDYTHLQNKTLVAIDPGMSDLLYCVDGSVKGSASCRYSQGQRLKETKKKRYRDIILLLKRKRIDGKTITQWETSLSIHNCKTMDVQKFKAYLSAHHDFNRNIGRFYEKEIFRKLRLGAYMRTQISESRFLAKMREKFGKPEEVTIAIGDWCQYKHREYKDPTKGVGFRTMFRRAGYSLYLVNEDYTSKTCAACDGETEKFRWVDNPKPERIRKENSPVKVLRHGLLRCQSCAKLWNRDTNGASNIYRIARAAIDGEERPKALSPPEKKEPTTTVASTRCTQDILKLTQLPIFPPQQVKRAKVKIVKK